MAFRPPCEGGHLADGAEHAPPEQLRRLAFVRGVTVPDRMRELAREGGFAYVQFEASADIDRVQVRGVETDPGGFEFFRGLGIVGYSRTFKAWLRHFPRPLFL